jgi:translation elongation factor EF-1beta
VLTVLKIFPEEDASLSGIASELSKINGFVSSKEQEIAFGAKAIVASFQCEDSEGRDFEDEVKTVKGVSEAQVEEVGLI